MTELFGKQVHEKNKSGLHYEVLHLQRKSKMKLTFRVSLQIHTADWLVCTWRCVYWVGPNVFTTKYVFVLLNVNLLWVCSVLQLQDYRRPGFLHASEDYLLWGFFFKWTQCHEKRQHYSFARKYFLYLWSVSLDNFI